MRRVWATWRADAVVLAHRPVVVGTLLVLAAWVAYSTYQQANVLGIVLTAGYYLRQGLLATALLSWWAVALVACMVGAVERNGEAEAWRFAQDDARALGWHRVLLCLAIGLAYVVVIAAIGVAMDAWADLGTAFGLRDLAGFLVVWGVVCLWSVAAWFLGTVIRNAAVGWACVVVVFFLLTALSAWLPVSVARIFPVWNIDNVLLWCFPQREAGFMMVPQAPAGRVGLSTAILVAWLAGFIGASIAYNRRRQF